MQKTTHEPILVNVRTASEMLSISERSIAELVKTGKIPSVKIQGRRLFDVEALKAWAREQLSTCAN
jgi:excisionase family DNA binding protein